jgi:hypothetical protein
MSQREAPESTTKAEEKNDNLLFLSREKGMFYRVLNNYRDFPLPSLLLLHDCLPACLLKASNIQLSFFSNFASMPSSSQASSIMRLP